MLDKFESSSGSTEDGDARYGEAGDGLIAVTPPKDDDPEDEIVENDTQDDDEDDDEDLDDLDDELDDDLIELDDEYDKGEEEDKRHPDHPRKYDD